MRFKIRAAAVFAPAYTQALKTVNNTIKTTQSELKDVSRLLKLDPSNTELLSQKQRALKDAVSATKKNWTL